VLLALDVNGEAREIAAPQHWTLLEVLRYSLGLTGSKQGCDKGDCGACTVIIDGEAKLACLTLAVAARGSKIRTIEGLATPSGLDPVQEAFDVCGALQCGFCQSGMMMSARALLDHHPHPTDAQMKKALSGNLCRCTGYTKIFDAVREAERLSGSGAD
jgi:aerobic-type carbon monoxide dehydrogenase small subunit (CoxS/CutS family)